MKQQKAIPHTQWPERDKHAWQAAMASGDRFDGRGAASHWAEGSKKSIRAAYGRWLRFLEHTFPHLLDADLDKRATADSIGAYINQLNNEVSAATTQIYIDHLSCALRVMAPNHDWHWLKPVVRRLGRGVNPKAKRHRMVDSIRLFDLGISLMDQAIAEPVAKPLDHAILYRDGLLIAILAARPMRRRTLSLICLDQHLCQVGDHYTLVFSSKDTKNRHPIEYALPLTLSAYLDRYLGHYRGLFPNTENHDGLWASAKGSPLSGSSLYRRVISRTQTAFGFSINPHLFRDCAATTLAIHKPDQVLTGAGLLGHSDLRTIHKHYIHAETIKAGDAHQKTITRLRRGLVTVSGRQ
jgi:integrase/recombinase XerD